MQTLLQKTFDELEKLGSPDSIALFLKDKKIKGLLKNEDYCPLANYIHNIDPSSPEIFHFYMLGNNVQEFIKNFDNNEYPYLVEETKD